MRTIVLTTEFYGKRAYAQLSRSYRRIRKMMNVYAEFAENFMAIPVVKGIKQKQNDLWSRRNYCIEALMQDGKASSGNVIF
jgi:prolyl-tRNA synthetase